MFNRFPHKLCTLSLAALLAISPVAAVGTIPEQARPNWETSVTLPDAPIMADSLPSSGDYSRQGQYLRYSPKLQAKGYAQEEIDLIFSRVPINRIMVLLRYDYSNLIAQYAAQPHFRGSSFERYIRYGRENPTLTAGEIVTAVNIGLDREFYTNLRLTRNTGAHDVLVNKFNYLSTTFKPDLVRMGSRYAGYTAYLEPTAYEWFTKMVDAAQADGVWLYCVSAYRSYSYQRTLYQRYVNQSGQAAADTFSARPGFSEHQTGLAVDINTASTSAHFENTQQYRWLAEHCWEYGFILRYPEGKEHITGFQFEPWHYRYVGRKLAQAVHESGLTYDEYVACLPTGDLPQARYAVLAGEPISLRRAAVFLNDTHYLTAQDLADTLALSCTLSADGTALLRGTGVELRISRDSKAILLNGGQASLEHAPMAQSGDLLLPVEDLAQLLGLEVSREGELLLLCRPVATTSDEAVQPTAEIPVS